MKIVYQDNFTRKIRKLRRYAQKLKEGYLLNSPLEALIANFGTLDETYSEIINELPDEFKPLSQLGRHISWTGRYLHEGSPESCRGDVFQICEVDIDDFEDSYVDFQNRRYLNKEIANSVIKLLAEENNDSAVRKAFIILTNYLREKFAIEDELDGRKLINTLFGKNSGQINISSDKREAYRDLLSGMYGVFRNEYGHNHQEEWSFEADIVVGLINVIMSRIENLIDH